MKQHVGQPATPPLAKHKQLYAALCSLPENILGASGRFLYSSISTLQPGMFYLLGYNPGGNPNEVTTSLKDEFDTWGVSNANAYLDEVWNRSPYAGCSLYQRNVQNLCKALMIDTRNICSSNLYFTRSISAATLRIGKTNFFWPVHEIVLDIVMPKCILAIGLNTYRSIADILELSEKSTFCSGHGTWQCHTAEGLYQNRPLKLLGLPHFSRYSLRGRTGVLAQIAEECSHIGRDNGNHS